jgi:hypothetical protein
MIANDDAMKAVRDIRRKISAEFDHDPKKLVEHYMAEQEKHRDRLIRREVESTDRENGDPVGWE